MSNGECKKTAGEFFLQNYKTLTSYSENLIAGEKIRNAGSQNSPKGKILSLKYFYMQLRLQMLPVIK